MTDFETHPVGTAYLVKRLRAYEGEGFETTACYNGLRSEAADSIEQLEAAHRAVMEEHDYTAKRLGHAFERIDRQAETIDKLTARANAATAAAYEVAARVLDDEIDMARIAMPQVIPILSANRRAIRALATPDQTAALDKLIAEAVAPYKSVLKDLIDHADEISSPLVEAQLLLAASKKGGV